MVQYDTRNWLGLLLRWHGTVVPRIAVRVVVTTALAAVVTAVHGNGIAALAIPTSVHTLVGVALGLLLVFRTNASYDRYWEGRRLVGAIVNHARNLARQTAAYLDSSAPATRLAQGHRIAALYPAIRRHLRGERTWPELATRLPAAELAALDTVRCPPLRVARSIAEGYAAEAQAGRLSEVRVQLLDAQLAAISDALGGCERILRTPVPFAYAHHIKGFLTLFCFTVPLALLDSLGAYTPLAAAVVAYAMFGIDEIGVEIEDPFGYDPNDLPLDAVGQVIDTDVDQTMASGAASSSIRSELDRIRSGSGPDPARS